MGDLEASAWCHKSVATMAKLRKERWAWQRAAEQVDALCAPVDVSVYMGDEEE